MLNGEDRIRLAKHHHREGMRLKLCKAVGKDRGALDGLACSYFEARDWSIGEARRLLDRRKLFSFSIVSIDFDNRNRGQYIRRDELEAGVAYEMSCESVGIDPGPYRVVKNGRVRL